MTSVCLDFAIPGGGMGATRRGLQKAAAGYCSGDKV